MTYGDLTIILILLVAAAFAILSIRKGKKRGGCPCGGGCSHCCGNCHKRH